MKDNRAFVVTGYGAARLMAETTVKSTRPGGKRVPPCPCIYWEDATEEMRNDPNRIWFTESGRNKKTFRRHTPEEKEEIRLNQIWRLEQIYLVLLNKYGWKYAERFAEEEKEKFEKYNIKINSKIPHCEYTQSGQCDLFCPFFNKKCLYKGEKIDENRY